MDFGFSALKVFHLLSNLSEHEFYSLDFINFCYKDNQKSSQERKLQNWNISWKESLSLNEQVNRWFLPTVVSHPLTGVCQLRYPYLPEPECRENTPQKLQHENESIQLQKEGVDMQRNVEEV